MIFASHYFINGCLYLQSESLQKHLVIMERAVNLNSYQPKQACYRQLPVVEGNFFPTLTNATFKNIEKEKMAQILFLHMGVLLLVFICTGHYTHDVLNLLQRP